MGVKIRERKLALGLVAFYIDTYHKDFGRFSQKSGYQADPKIRKEYKKALAAAQDKAREIEKDLQRDPAGVFGRKAMAAEDFRDYYRQFAERDKYSKYMNVLPLLDRFSGEVIPFSTLNAAWLERFKKFLVTVDTINQNTASGYLVSVKTVLRQLYKEGFLHEDITTKVAGIKRKDVKRNFLNIEQVEALSQIECDSEMIKQAFLFACFTGLRLSDVERLQWDQINFINGDPFIQFQQRKTSQYENLPLSDQAVKTLQDVKELHSVYSPEGSQKVFILPSRQRIQQVLYSWGLRARLPFRLTFHISRHTFATMSLAAGTDLYTVGKLLGHREIRTTQVYARVIDESKVKAVQALPVLAMNKGLPEADESSEVKPEQSFLVQALKAKGERIAKALDLEKNEEGKYEFAGHDYSAAELAVEVSGGE